MNSQVFREYDIRGIVANDFDDEFVTDLGRGYATLLHQAGKKTVTLGRDCRLSSDRLRDRLAEGLLGAGIDWYLFNKHVVVAAQITFPMAVTPHLVVIALFWALSIALLGGILPSIRAARLPVATAMRAG